MSQANDAATRLIRITGTVQGVWFRGWTVKTARSLGLSGWVRNRRDGSVESLFHGPTIAVDEMIVACGKGPPAVRVEEVTVVEAPPPEKDLADGFVQRPTI